MLTCFVCKATFRNSNHLISHLRVEHGYYPGQKFKLYCSQEGCRRNFLTYAGFRMHLNSVHSADQQDAFNVPCSNPEPVEMCHNEDSYGQFCPSSESRSSRVTIEIGEQKCTKDSTKDMCTSIVAKLQGSGISSSLLSSIVGDLEELTSSLRTQAKQAVLEVLPAGDPSISLIDSSFKKMENPFVNLNSEWKRNKYFSEKWGVVEPVECILGVRYDNRRNPKSGQYEQVPVRDTFIYVPILDSLKFMCKNTEICDLMKRDLTSAPDLLTDLNDGSYFKSHPLFSTKKHAFQIQLYYDDFEPANPLGSKRGIHKIGCLYFVIRNLPPKFNSVLMNIHLVSLFHVQDLQKYGFDAILRPLINDVQKLESHGIDVPFFDEPVYGTIAQVTGDNLGMHTILGFTESFSSHHFCRLCLIDKSDSQNVYSEDNPKVVFRGKELFAVHCQSLQENPQLKSVFGLKRNSALNTLAHFHVCNNYSFDIMHDLLEGVAQYEIKLLFCYVTQNFISESDLLSRIYSFDYGFLERKNRPTKIILDGSGNGIGLNSIQTLCLVKNIPLLLGDLFPAENEYWHLLLLLLQIMNIVFSPSLTVGMTVYLKNLIADHHRLFKMLYPQRNLLPKHHFMIHYPSSIRKVGPLLYLWSMRFEAKHKVLKNYFKNFKNLTKSIAKKHQRAIAFHWETLPLQTKEYGPIKLFDLNNMIAVVNIHLLETSKEVYATSWVKINGIEYRSGLVIWTAMNDDMPVFCEICDVLLVEDSVFFLTTRLLTETFDEHSHAFKVFRCENKCLLTMSELKSPKPFDIQRSYCVTDDTLYIIPAFTMF